MKIALAQQNYHIGNFEANTQKIIAGIRQAKAMGAELVLFFRIVCLQLSAAGLPGICRFYCQMQ